MGESLGIICQGLDVIVRVYYRNFHNTTVTVSTACALSLGLYLQIHYFVTGDGIDHGITMVDFYV